MWKDFCHHKGEVCLHTMNMSFSVVSSDAQCCGLTAELNTSLLSPIQISILCMLQIHVNVCFIYHCADGRNCRQVQLNAIIPDTKCKDYIKLHQE